MYRGKDSDGVLQGGPQLLPARCARREQVRDGVGDPCIAHHERRANLAAVGHAHADCATAFSHH